MSKYFNNKTKEDMKGKILYYLQMNDALFEHLPYGAYIQAMQDSVVKYNEMNKTNLEPYETAMEYFKQNSSDN